VTFEDLVGQDAAAAALRRAVSAGRVAHAYLFVGPEAVGKRTAAFCLAKALNCREPRDGDACDACESCRRIEQGTHPDVRLIGPTLEDSPGYLTPVPDDAPGPATIRMAQIRTVPGKPRQAPGPLVHDISLRPAFAAWKVYVISPADRMQQDTANALLHVLEEPPTYAVIILVTARPAAILPTVQSRCRELRFRLASSGEIAACLEGRGVDAPAARRLARLAAGRTGWAIRAAASPEMLRAREALVEWIEGLCEAPPQAALKVAEDLRVLAYQAWRGASDGESEGEEAPEGGDGEPPQRPQAGGARPLQRLSEDQLLRARLPDSLEVVLRWLRDLAVLRCGRPDLAVSGDDDPRLAERAAAYSVSDLRRAMSSVQRAMRYIEQRASIPITTDALAEVLIGILGRPDEK